MHTMEGSIKWYLFLYRCYRSITTTQSTPSAVCFLTYHADVAPLLDFLHKRSHTRDHTIIYHFRHNPRIILVTGDTFGVLTEQKACHPNPSCNAYLATR